MRWRSFITRPSRIPAVGDKACHETLARHCRSPDALRCALTSSTDLLCWLLPCGMPAGAAGGQFPDAGRRGTDAHQRSPLLLAGCSGRVAVCSPAACSRVC